MKTAVRRTAATAAVLLLTGAGVPGETVKFPAFYMIRGGDLEAPVVLHHTKFQESGGTRFPAFDEGNVLAGIMMSLQASEIRYEAELPESVRYEVAAFMAAEWYALIGPDGKPTVPLVFEEGTAFSTIHRPTAGGQPIWERGSGMNRFREIPAASVEAMRIYGLEWAATLRAP